jgi:MoaA/NifB/PqqE/SkfB family radical SAM enzyme
MFAWRKKARLLKAYLRGNPVWCSWQVTYACNYRCGFCDYWKEEVNYSPGARAREATLDDIRLGAAKLGELGSLMISLAGGEPFLRRDLAEITSILARQHFPLVTTNGSLVTEQRARQLWEAGLVGISVSLDSVDNAVHDANRGVAGAADCARRALRILSTTRTQRDQRVNLMCVLSEQNLGEVEGLIRFAAENSCSFTIQQYAAIKNGKGELIPSGKTTRQLLALRKRYRNFLSNPVFLRNFDRFYEERGIPGCRAGRAFFNIDNFLNVEKCVEFREETIGNLRYLSAGEMLRGLRAESERNRCRACWYNCRGEVEALYSIRGLMGSLPRLVG